MDYKELIETLKNIEAIAYGYNINGEVLGMDCSEFEQIIVDAFDSITDLLARTEAAEARAEKAERERDYAIKQLKIAADEDGGCWGCKWFDDMTEKCTNPEGMVSCSTVTNNMWEWRGLKEE